MKAQEILIEAYGRLPNVIHAGVADLDQKQLTHRPGPKANSIDWLVWHIGRVIDAQVANLAGTGQVWHGGWSQKFALPFDESATGYGQTSDEVAAVQASADLLLGYFDAVLEQALAYFRALSDTDLDEIVDTNWNPPVSRGIRLVSILGDINQHAGQVSYLHGLLTTK
ncbi:MAG TPA: DinB family protein [Candidatus Saccharimonadaceae bacterium]|nr:DinB family protein [Candidatus Saccharimonadaceae bacterium]